MDDRGYTIFFEKVREALPGETYLVMPEGELTIHDLWRALESQAGLNALQLAAVLSRLSDIPLAENLGSADIDVIGKFPYATATGMCALPQRMNNGHVVVAVANPFDDNLHQTLRFVFGIEYELELASPTDLDVAIAKAYADIEDARGAGSGRHGSKVLRLGEELLEERQIPKLARQLMMKAIEEGASDMHVQPFVGGAAVRLRVDGMLRRLVILPDKVSDALVRYFKSQTSMDPTNRRIQQDGRMSLQLAEQRFDLRLSTLPVVGEQEKLVIRILKREKEFDLGKNGLSLQGIRTLRQMANSPSGVVLLCGPTGCGKTTTLYSLLADINHEGISITTVENPVEYRMPGVSQTEINPKAGLTFADALRATLRQDPDVILVGEIRDRETAQIAMQASLTGHRVFSTLHTNTAVAAIPRLLDLGIPPSILSQALVGLVSQRLLRKLCENCRIPVADAPSRAATLFEEITRIKPGAVANGCEACNFTGYAGRVVVTEMLHLNARQAQMIARGEDSPEALIDAAGKDYITISGAAARRIISGETTALEASRVLGRRFWLDIAREYGSDSVDFGSMDDTLSGSASQTARAAVLLAGNEGAFPDSIHAALQESWMDVLRAHSPDEAEQVLRQHDRTALVVLDIPATLDDEEAAEYVARYRTRLAWSRLPALLMIARDKQHLQQYLRERGATSRFMYKPFEAADLVQTLLQASATNADFRWGLEPKEPAIPLEEGVK